MAKSPVTTAWRNRIIGHGTEEPSQLLAHPANWRIHPKNQQDALSGVLNEIGWIQSVIVNQRTGFVIDGHLRVALAISHHEPEIPVVYVDLSDEEEALALASIDPISAMAATDKTLLDDLLRDVSSADAGVQAMLSDLAEKNGLAFGGVPEPGDGGDEFDPTPDEGPTRCQPGDLWLIGGRHRLLCGDSTNADDVARLMDSDRAAMMWTDPPYGVDYVGKTKEALTIRNDLKGGLEGLLTDAFSAANDALGDGAAIYVAHPPGALSVTFDNCFVGQGWRLHQTLIWVKNSMVLGHSDYHFKHEPITFGYKSANGRRGRGGDGWYGPNNAVSVFEVDRPSRSEDHPTMKPVELIEPMIENSSRAGEVVYDPFLGSGSTLIAAHRTGRTCYGLELDPKYADVILRRAEAEGLTVERLDE